MNIQNEALDKLDDAISNVYQDSELREGVPDPEQEKAAIVALANLIIFLTNHES